MAKLWFKLSDILSEKEIQAIINDCEAEIWLMEYVENILNMYSIYIN